MNSKLVTFGMLFTGLFLLGCLSGGDGQQPTGPIAPPAPPAVLSSSELCNLLPASEVKADLAVQADLTPQPGNGTKTECLYLYPLPGSTAVPIFSSAVEGISSSSQSDKDGIKVILAQGGFSIVAENELGDSLRYTLATGYCGFLFYKGNKRVSLSLVDLTGTGDGTCDSAILKPIAEKLSQRLS